MTIAARAVRSTHIRRAHTAVRNGRRVQVRAATVHTTRAQIADAVWRSIGTWRALTAPGPGRAQYAGKVAVSAGAVAAVIAGQVASGLTAVAVGVLTAAVSMLIAVVLPKHLNRRWLEPRWWHQTRRHLRAARIASRPHLQRGRAIAHRTRQATRPTRRRA